MLNIFHHQYTTAPDQECVEDGAAVLVFAGVYAWTTRKYGERGMRYVHMEGGMLPGMIIFRRSRMGGYCGCGGVQ